MKNEMQIDALSGEETPGLPINPPKLRPLSHSQRLNKLYTLPAPLRTFPLPTLVPHNPLSLFHILYLWLSQALNPVSSHFDPLYQGWFSPETRAVHVTESRSIRGLWEQGFYGKGSLSRSEPNWLDGEMARRANQGAVTCEELTRRRREERQKVKWERARKEREAIDQKLLEEATASSLQQCLQYPAFSLTQEILNLDKGPVPSITVLKPPVGPREILSLPNSPADLKLSHKCKKLKNTSKDSDDSVLLSPLGLLEVATLRDAVTNNAPSNMSVPRQQSNPRDCEPGTAEHSDTAILRPIGHEDFDLIEVSDTTEEIIASSNHLDTKIRANTTRSSDSMSCSENPKILISTRRKSVRFSSNNQEAMFSQSEPPSPERAAGNSTLIKDEPVMIENQEHFQLTLEEAFFLTYALGALQVLDPTTHSPIPNRILFRLFRQNSHFPPQSNPTLSTDDTFMINYVVYHHFRSLGWVVRSGIKFSVDFMLYNRGPVFSHAEFAVLILPSYTDTYWTSSPLLKSYSRSKQDRTWAWMSCINRVIAQVKKTLILCYVDIPRPLEVEEEETLRIDAVLARYKVREFIMTRFVANRMRT